MSDQPDYPWLDQDYDLEGSLEWMDPDWREHFASADQAFCHYLRYAPEDLKAAIEENAL